MGKGTFDLKAEKIELRYQYAPKMKKHELFYKLLRLVTVVCEIWVYKKKEAFKTKELNFTLSTSICLCQLGNSFGH